MPRVVPESLIDQAVELYESGQSCQKIGSILGIHPETIRVRIRDRGVELDPHRYESSRRIPVNPDALRRYSEGESLYAISKSTGVSRKVIERWARESGIEIRGSSDAGKLRASRLSKAERIAQVAAANKSARGRTVSRGEQHARATTIFNQTISGERPRSHLEVQLGRWLTERGVNFVPEQVADIYNVDFGIEGTVAVELLGGSWHAQPSRREHHRHRTHDILNAGWHMIFVWSTHYTPINPWAADKIVSLSKEASRHPATPGKYWVIRGDGEVMSTGSGKSDDFTLELPHHRDVRLWP